MSNYIVDRQKIKSDFDNELYKTDFEGLTHQIFLFQYKYNLLYRKYCDLLNKRPDAITNVEAIPFLPIEFFKSQPIKTGVWEADKVFRSSGTTGQVRSQHYIRDLNHYLTNACLGFEEHFGKVTEFCFLAVLPGYMERSDSSLIFMLQEFINKSKYDTSGFYLGKEQEMLDIIKANRKKGIRTILFGVSFGLLDLCKYKIDFKELTVIETGGMKSSKIDMTKQEILERFQDSWNVKAICSEYGMTELLSQSYAIDSNWYQASSTKKITIGSLRDPFSSAPVGKTGLIKVIDLANFDTCSFIETQDLGISNGRSLFQVVGRMDNAELRGCNLLLEESLKNPIG